jgi:flagellar basal-body rod protein FlgC
MDGGFGAIEISAAGLAAQRARMDIIAENLAHSDTTRTIEGGPYRRKLVVFAAEPTGSFAAALAGVPLQTVRVAGIVESPEPPRLVHHPWHPDADGNGYVAFPNINPMLEMMDLLAATRAYEANVTAIQTTKSMASKALEIGR